MEFRYELAHGGWADCVVEIQRQRVELTAFYLTAALDDVAGAVVGMFRGELSMSALFHAEPTEFRWRFAHAADASLMRVRILTLDDFEGYDILGEIAPV